MQVNLERDPDIDLRGTYQPCASGFPRHRHVRLGTPSAVDLRWISARLGRDRRRTRGFRSAVALASFCIGYGGLSSTASAADAPPPESSASAPALAPAASEWQVSVAPYVWLPSLKGDMGVSSELPTVSLDLSAKDILDMFVFGLMAKADVRRDRFVAGADGMYVDLKVTKGIGIQDASFGQAALKTKMLVATGLAGYRIYDGSSTSIDLFGGARVVGMKLDLALTGPQRTLAGSKDKTWVDPVVGGRVHGPLGGKWSYNAYGDIGGFGAASKLTWQLLGTVDYQASSRWNVSLGWRHLDIDYADDGFVADVAMDGPIVSAAYRF